MLDRGEKQALSAVGRLDFINDLPGVGSSNFSCVHHCDFSRINLIVEGGRTGVQQGKKLKILEMKVSLSPRPVASPSTSWEDPPVKRLDLDASLDITPKLPLNKGKKTAAVKPKGLPKAPKSAPKSAPKVAEVKVDALRLTTILWQAVELDELEEEDQTQEDQEELMQPQSEVNAPSQDSQNIRSSGKKRSSTSSTITLRVSLFTP